MTSLFLLLFVVNEQHKNMESSRAFRNFVIIISNEVAKSTSFSKFFFRS